MESTSKHNNHKTSEELSDDIPSNTLLPGLPNHLAELCLSSVHLSLLYKVSHSWRRLIYSPSFPPFFSLYALLSPSPSHQTVRNHMYDSKTNSIKFLSLDPISSTWQPLPSPPPYPPLHILHRHPVFLVTQATYSDVNCLRSPCPYCSHNTSIHACTFSSISLQSNTQ